jgi:hypothetical protein
MAVIISSIPLILSCNLDIVEVYFSNYEDIGEDGVFEGGGIPRFLPRSSYDIHYKADLDVGKVWVTFKFAKDDLGNIKDSLIVPDSVRVLEIKRVMKGEFRIYAYEVAYFEYSSKEYVAIDVKNMKCYNYRDRH